MRIHIEPEARTLLKSENHSVITVKADHECVGANCSESFTYPVITFKVPDVNEDWKYERFSVDGVTVFFDKTLETVPEVAIAREPHILKDRITLKGLDVPPPVTHIKL
jgi:hypothetical protein